MNIIDDQIYDVDYKHTNITILHGSVSNMSLVISEGKFGSIDDEE